MSRMPLPVGTEIDHYLIKQMLSEDGRGISYLAVDTRSVSGSTKVLLREYFPRGISVRENGEIAPRGRVEAQAEFEHGLSGFIEASVQLISFKTHALVPAQDIIEENGTAYLALEWPEGRSFTEMSSEDEPMSIEVLRSQLAILKTGLDHLHGAGLIHTAISPETLIRLDDGYPAISHLTHVQRFDGNIINRTHILFDTPYAAPELRADTAAPIGPWTDVYGLAATCWFLLTGKAPSSAADRLAFITAGRGDKLDANALAERGEPYPKIANVLLEGMELLPERRFASVADFVIALDAAASNTGPAWLVSAKQFVWSRRMALAGTAAALALAFVLLGNDTAPANPAAEEHVAELPTETGAGDAELTPVVAPILPPEPASDPEPARMLASAAWLLVDNTSASDVRAFIEDYRDEPVATAIAAERLQLLDERAWSAALAEGTIGAFEAYLSDFGPDMRPQGLHVDEANARILKITGAREFQVAEVRRLMYAMGFKTNNHTGVTKGLTRAIKGFQESIGVEPDGEITDRLIEQLTDAVSRQDAEDTTASEEAQREEEAALRAEEAALADARFVELVREAAISTTRTATGEIGRIETAETDTPADPEAMIAPPTAEPKIVFETKVAGSALARKKIESETPKPKLSPVRKPGDTFKDCETCPDMTVLPAGVFEMGSPSTERERLKNEGPLHRVQISAAFAIAAHEVTLREYSAFVRDTGRKVPPGCYAETSEHTGEWARDASLSFQSPGFAQGPDHPVVCVSWQDATDYALWLSQKTGETYRLPSEAEWEYAARAGSQTARYFARSYRSGCKFANGADRTAKKARKTWVTASCTDGYLATAPAGSFQPNAFGLHDMLGNVWEWTADCYANTYASTPRTEAAHSRSGCKTYVTRGGSWASGTDMLRSAARSGDMPSARYDMLGFRVVRDIPRP